MLEKVAARSGRSYAATSDVLDAFFEELVDYLVNGGDGANYHVTNFGSFKRVKRAARCARNPVTGEPMQVPESNSVKLVLADKMKRNLNVVD